MHHPRPLAVIAGALGTIVCAIFAFAAGCSASSPKPSAPPTEAASTTAVSTPTAKPPPSPTAAPADPKLGDTLRYEGEFEKAIDVYASVADKADGQKRQDALLAQAQLLSRTKRYSEAKIALQSWLSNAGTGANGSSAQYMLASTLDDLHDPQGALTNYDAYIAANGPAADFARIERAKMLVRVGRPLDAEQAAEAVLASGLQQQFKASFTFTFARTFEDAHADANALSWFNHVKVTPQGDVASALAHTAAIKQRLGDATWAQDALEEITSYPASDQAPALLDQLDAGSVPVGDFVRGVVDYRARRNDLARAALVRAIAQNTHAGEATYYIGALDERAGDLASAVANYQRAQQIDPATSVADDALWWRGRLLEGAGRLTDAAAVYGELASRYPTSEWFADAEFRRGLATYRSGGVAAAAQMFAAIVPHETDDDALRARYWQGRALSESGDANGRQVLAQLHNDKPASFYGLRAEVLLNKNDTNQRQPSLKDSSPDWEKVAKYIKEQTGTDPDAANFAPLEDARWAQADELQTVGLMDQADAVIRAITTQYAGDPTALMLVTKRLEQDGQTSNAARAATRLLDALPEHAAAPPDDLLRVAYPLVYDNLVKDASKKENISPLLLLSLVRQESYYDPDAGSSAGALGLTQVVPTTGSSIAQTLGVEQFSADDLYRPKVSILFGASYLADQLSEFNSDPYRALAAYNGGPGTASNAASTSAGDEDVFVEDLEFDETKAYVKRVMENYGRYRQLYENLDRPSLPR